MAIDHVALLSDALSDDLTEEEWKDIDNASYLSCKLQGMMDAAGFEDDLQEEILLMLKKCEEALAAGEPLVVIEPLAAGAGECRNQ